jgi:hypothetical protein
LKVTHCSQKSDNDLSTFTSCEDGVAVITCTPNKIEQRKIHRNWGYNPLIERKEYNIDMLSIIHR